MRNRFVRDIIGLDLDSVLCNTEYVLDKFIREEFGVIIDWENEVKEYALEKMPGITLDQSIELKERVESGEVLKSIQTYNYSEHATKKLRNEGFAIAIITSRPSRLKAVTMDWLEEHDIVYDLLYCIESSKKHELIQELDIKAFVEDRFDTLESVLENCGSLDYGLYCIYHHWNKRFSNDRIVFADDIADAVDKIVEFRRWRGYFLTQCAGNIEKFIKEYQDGK